MREVAVSEIHRYPMRPRGFEEPLFPTPESRRAVLEHLLEAPWLSRASELGRGAGGAGSARRREEPVELLRRSGAVHVVRPGGGRCSRGCSWRSSWRSSWQRRRVVEVLARWRCVRGWWDAGGRVDRMLFRVLLSGSAVVDLALERPGRGPERGPARWLLAGVED